jgi:hypothetical protein
MALIAEKLVVIDKVFDIASQVLKRQQQLGLMLDGYGSNHGRRLNDVQTELALMRAAPRSQDDVETEDAPVQGQKARAVKLTGKVLMYGATVAALLRMLGNIFPEHKATIDGVLEGVGL